MFKVKVNPELLPEPVFQVGEQLDLETAIEQAGWNVNDPGVGRAVLLEDGREVVSPAQFSEPADIEAGQDMFAVMERRIIAKLQRDAGLLRGDDVVDTAEDENDFNVSDDINYVSGFEVEMASEFPSMPTPPVKAGVAELGLAEAEAELAALQKVVDERKAAVAAAIPPAVPPNGT